MSCYDRKMFSASYVKCRDFKIVILVAIMIIIMMIMMFVVVVVVVVMMIWCISHYLYRIIIVQQQFNNCCCCSNSSNSRTDFPTRNRSVSGGGGAVNGVNVTVWFARPRLLSCWWWSVVWRSLQHVHLRVHVSMLLFQICLLYLRIHLIVITVVLSIVFWWLIPVCLKDIYPKLPVIWLVRQLFSWGYTYVYVYLCMYVLFVCVCMCVCVCRHSITDCHCIVRLCSSCPYCAALKHSDEGWMSLKGTDNGVILCKFFILERVMCNYSWLVTCRDASATNCLFL